LESLNPQLALVSVEAGNRRGLPSAVVLEALAGTTVLRTDVNGWIHISTDGERMWTEVERLP
jgi:competence protein ComEC